MGTVESPILVVASEYREISGVLRHSRMLRRLALPLDFAAAGELSGRRFFFAANGPGSKLAAQAAGVVGEREDVGVVVSVGLCGGLNPALRFGDVVVAREIQGVELGSFCPADPPKTDRPYFAGRMVSQDRVAGTVHEKRALWDNGGDAVEMEAAALARWANGRGAPFHCVRVVSDTAEESFRIDLNDMRRADGRFNRLRIVATALSRPVELLPELIRLDRRSRKAAVILGDFLASCEF
jgi:adenosylhomocysteine nucleosidase